MDFYEKVITQCREKGVSRSKMADDIGISRSTPKDWENGKVTPRYDTIKKLADYFGVPVAYFTENHGDTIESQNITDNHGIIGHTHAPVTIINGSERKLSEQEVELLNIFEKLSILDQAKLLVYANELVGDK